MKNAYPVTILRGDGIGPEVMDATLAVLRATGIAFDFYTQPVGEEAERLFGTGLPQQTLESIERDHVALKGPTATPVAGNRKSYNLDLRQRFDSYANVRPVRIHPGVVTRYSDEAINLVVVRENTEGEYSAVEAQNPLADSIESTARYTPDGCRRIAQFAFDYVRSHGRKKVPAIPQANICQMSHGLFLNTARAVASKYPDIEFEDMIADNFFQQLILRPSQFDVVIATNLLGDLASDAAAALVGGLGLAPGANVGGEYAIFEAVHGTADNIAGKGLANPSSLILSAAMMLDHLDEQDAGDHVRKALDKTLESGQRTGDIKTKRQGLASGTEQFTRSIIANL